MTSRFIVGTANFGLPYGIKNKCDRVRLKSIKGIIEIGKKNGIFQYDTAEEYGDAIKILGEYSFPGMEIISKCQVPKFNSTEAAVNFFISRLNKGKIILKKADLRTLLIHNPWDITPENANYICEAFKLIKDDHSNFKFGISIYDMNELHSLIPSLMPDIVQVPCNIFDDRFLGPETRSLKSKYGFEMHARSVFLQGLLLLNSDEATLIPPPVLPDLQAYWQLCSDSKKTLYEVALGYVAAQDLVDSLVLGVDNELQMERLGRFINDQTFFRGKIVPQNSMTIDPRRWK